jgi:two-component system phosphate regulon sensor histidine kinase PhoR
MPDNQESYQKLMVEFEAMKAQQNALQLDLEQTKESLEEATDTIEAIRTGEIDALVIQGTDGHQIYTLKSADQTYRIFIEQMTQGAITINRNGIILYSNSQFALLINQPLEKVIGQSFFNYVSHHDIKRCENMIEKAWDNVVSKGELDLSADEVALPVLLSLKTLDLDEGTSLSIIITDLGGQKLNEQLLTEKNKQLQKAEQLATQLNINLEAIVKLRTFDLEKSVEEKITIADQLYKSQQQLSNILETMAEGVQIIDTDNQLIYANKMAQQILGIKNFDIIKGKYEDPKWESFNLDGSKLPAHNHPIYLAMATGTPVYDFEICIKPPHQEHFYISVNAVPIYDEDNQLSGGIGTFMDVTQRRKSIQQKDDFISVASHELKTPITSLKAAIQLLDRIKDNPTDKMPKLVEQANKSMTKVSNLVEELLNASKITSGQMHINMVEFNLVDIIHDSYQHLPIKDKEKISLSGESSLIINGDPVRIEQVIVNFINNALKYAPASETIQILVERQGEFAKVEVIDNGPGIEKQKLAHLFDRYYRVDDSGQQYSGLGLGLYICSEIIKKHNGEIGVKSEINKGSIFWLTLPLVH